MNLFSILEKAAKKWPDEMAVSDPQYSLSYGELYAAASSMARDLQQAGLECGDILGLMGEKTVGHVAAIFAAFHVGVIIVPISTAFKKLEIAGLVDETRMDAVSHSPRLDAAVFEDENATVRYPLTLGDRAVLFLHRTRHWRSAPSERQKLLELDAAWIRFSSGTTSKAKGIIMSHATALRRGLMVADGFVLEKNSRSMWLWSTMDSLLAVLTACLLRGAGVVLADAMNLDELSRLLRMHRVTQICGMPMVYKEVLTDLSVVREDFRRVDCISMGNALPENLAQLFRERFGREIAQFYGLSECGIVMGNRSSDAAKRGAVGVLLPGCEARLVSTDAPSSEQDSGELLVRSPGFFDAYYKPWRPRAEVLEDGWFRTGDVARRDADGYYWIVGRIKEVINVGGTKVFPSELEETLLRHPAVEEAMVFGAPAPRFGEAPHAKVKLCAGAACTEKELLSYANERLSVFKALRSIELVDEIPRTAAGKPLRRDTA